MGFRNLPAHDELTAASPFGCQFQLRRGRVDDHAQPGLLGARRLGLLAAGDGTDQKPELPVVAGAEQELPLIRFGPAVKLPRPAQVSGHE